MATFGESSKNKLATCEKDLQTIFNKVVENFDNTIVYGHRTPEEQMELFKQGRAFINGSWVIVDKSKVVTFKDGTKEKSNHNYYPSHAVDATPFPIDWKDHKRLYYFAGIVMGVARQLKEEGKITHDLRWGGDWDSDNDMKDQTFMDDCHFELKM